MKLSRRFLTAAPDLFSEFDHFFNRAFSSPGLSRTRQVPDDFGIYESEEAWHLRTDLPGFRKEQVALELEKGVLTVEAKRDENEQGFHSDVTRRVQVPQGVDATGVEASLENGVLEITLPKVAPESPEALRIQIN